MADTSVRVRFAPSPTGYLHVGGARTALFNWLYARKMGGRMLLRIEDTDRERSSEEHVQVILTGLQWLGLDWDEEITFQARGVDRHRQLADRLLEEEKAYLDDGAVRFRMPDVDITWNDLIHGGITFKGSDIKDFVILRSDRTPTYNFSVVCDDMDMRVTDVLRGDDHISNTPKQIALYRALGSEVPGFGHVPMIHGPDGKKLSKRHGATAVGDYRNAGILPSAMRNFLALLGWSPGGDRELFFSTDELVEAFSLDGVQTKSAIFDPRKLEWMNGQHISAMPASELIGSVEQELRDLGLDASGQTDLLRAIDVVKERSRTTRQVAEQVAARLRRTDVEPDEKARKLIARDAEQFRTAVSAVREKLNNLTTDRWTPEDLDTFFRGLSEETGLGLGKLMQPVRVALTGGTVSEPVTELLPLVGKEESIRRLERAEGWD